MRGGSQAESELGGVGTWGTGGTHRCAARLSAFGMARRMGFAFVSRVSLGLCRTRLVVRAWSCGPSAVGALTYVGHALKTDRENADWRLQTPESGR
jgi:hypothetical protein